MMGGLAAAAELKDVPHPEFGSEGFEVIYDGKELGSLETEGNWIVKEDGSLALEPRPGEKGWERYGSYLWLPGEYEDFTVDLEFKYGKGGNSGLYFRIGDESDATKNGFEVQILDSYGKEEALIHHDMGGLVKVQPPFGNASKPAGEWARMTVKVEDGSLQVILNGKLVQDMALPDKLPSGKPLPEKGRIAIQDHGEPFSVRKIQVKRL